MAVSPAPTGCVAEFSTPARNSATINLVPPETRQPDPADFPVLTAAPEAAEILARLDGLETRLTAWHDYYAKQFRTIDGKLDELEAAQAHMWPVQVQVRTELLRLGAMADKAEKFIGNPIGAYKAAKLRRLPRDG